MKENEPTTITTKVAMIEVGRAPRPIEGPEGAVFFHEDGKDAYKGIPIFTMTRKMATHLATANPARYRLIGEDVLDAKVSVGSGAFKWVKVYPWKMVEETRQVIEDGRPKMEKGQAVYEKSVRWVEDPRAIQEREVETRKKAEAEKPITTPKKK